MKIELTEAEAAALRRMAGSVFDYPDAAKSMFETRRELKVALNACKKIGMEPMFSLETYVNHKED